MERSLLQRIETFLKEAAMPPTLFGRIAVRDPRLVSDLRNGRQPGRQITDRAEHFMNKWRAEQQAGQATASGDRQRRCMDAATGGLA